MRPLAKKIAVLPGDGIGREVVPVAVEVIDAAARLFGHELTFVEFPWSCDTYLETGRMMPEDGLETLREFDAILLGAVGDPARVPDHVSLWGLLIAIRRGFQQSVNLRPVRSLVGVSTPLASQKPFDILFVRENSEGEYSKIGGSIHEGPDEVVMQTSVFTRRATEAIVRHGFDLARSRRSRLTSATKSNGITATMPFWDRVVREVAHDFPDVSVEAVHVDALSARLVTAPETLDVVVGSNLFVDILSDIGAAIMGSLGLAPSGNIDPTGSAPPMFEPVHGSAPDIAGTGIANPLAQIWSGSLMLQHLGMSDAAVAIERAFQDCLRVGEMTPDLGGKLSTVSAGQAVERRLAR